MKIPPLFLAIGAASLLVIWGLWYLISGWGLVTINVTDAPVDRVLSSISRQGGIEIVSNLDPDTRVTLKVRRVPPLEALDIVATRTDANWRLTYLGAPDNGTIDSALQDFRAGTTVADWTSYGTGGGFAMVEPSSGPLDLRRVQWSPENADDLPALLTQAAEKTGVTIATPSDWSPSARPPRAGPVSTAVPRAISDAGGIAREVFLVRGPTPGRGGDDMGPGGGFRGGGAWIGQRPQNTGPRPAGAPGGPFGGNLDAAVDRMAAQVATLPKADQKAALEDLAMMQKFRDEMNGLSEEERRAKAMEWFSRPEVAERMEDRRLAREAKMTPQQRIDRSKRYIERKQAAKERATN